MLGCTPNDLCDWYATHPRETAPALSHEHAALLADYDACTPDRRDAVAQQLRDAAYMSREFAERSATKKTA